MTPTELIAAFDAVAEAPDGVARLRELVLQLAVRGRLVAQDPTDEPASVLLEHITAERARLVKAGRIANQQPLPPVSKHEVPFDVPAGWRWSSLGCLGPTQTGATPTKDALDADGPRIPFVRPSDVQCMGVDAERESVPRRAAEATGRIVQPGAVLMVCIGTIGKSALCTKEITFNQQINAVQVLLASSSYVAWALRSPTFQASCWSASSATTISILNKGNWERLPVPVPPLREQHRIAARVDELMGLLDRLEARLAAARTTHAAFAAAAVHHLDA